jgi:hypothetical protein
MMLSNHGIISLIGFVSRFVLVVSYEKSFVISLHLIILLISVRRFDVMRE